MQKNPEISQKIIQYTYGTCFLTDCYNCINSKCVFSQPSLMNAYRVSFSNRFQELIASYRKIALICFASSTFGTPSRVMLDMYKLESRKKDPLPLEISIHAIDPVNSYDNRSLIHKAFIDLLSYAKDSTGVYPCAHIKIKELVLANSVSDFINEAKIDKECGIMCTGYGYNRMMEGKMPQQTF